MPGNWQLTASISFVLMLVSCKDLGPSQPAGASQPINLPYANLIPHPVSVAPGTGFFTLSEASAIRVNPPTPEMQAIGSYLAERLRRATGFGLLVSGLSAQPSAGDIVLDATGADLPPGDEAYRLTVTGTLVSITARGPEGNFRGIQTLRQLFPAGIEANAGGPGPWTVPCCSLLDYPRFPWRGYMLDVARHFFGVQELERLIDIMAYYKMDRLHLHLSDNEGWRIAISARAKLTQIGGGTDLDCGPGGFLSREAYAEVAAYAQSRYITLVPEIDMPAHASAALASYPELACSGIAPPLCPVTDPYSRVLCVAKDTVLRFVDDVIGEIAALTPGPYMHVGGDEAAGVSSADYIRFIGKVQEIVQAHGKKMIGWEDVVQAPLSPSSIAQIWMGTLAQGAVHQGLKLIMSPTRRTYLDTKYNAQTILGQTAAGYIEVEDAYRWDPATEESGVGEEDILGVEAPLWTETIRSPADIDYMTFPRLIGVAEIGWSPAGGRGWAEYRFRLGSHGPRLRLMGVNFYPSPQVPWQ